MNEMKPIKRSPQLQSLSREHHDGLLFAWKIRQGLENKTSIDSLRNFVWWFWVNHMRQHIAHEEKILLPYLPVPHDLAVKLKSDHEEIKELIIAIDREPDLYEIKDLAKTIEIHIRWEERNFFQYFEEMLSTEELDKINNDLNNNPLICCEDWKDEFWVKK